MSRWQKAIVIFFGRSGIPRRLEDASEWLAAGAGQSHFGGVEKLTERISVKVTPALKRDIDELARRERRSMNQLFTMGMELLLENHKKTAIDKRGKRV